MLEDARRIFPNTRYPAHWDLGGMALTSDILISPPQAVEARGSRRRKNLDLWHTPAHISRVPTVRDKPKRTDRLVARITPDDKVLFERAATLQGASLAGFIVSHVRRAAQEVIRKHETIRLNEIESERFLKALLAPPGKAPARFVKALARYRETVTEQ